MEATVHGAAGMALIFATACTVNLEAGSQTAIACSSDADCPAGRVCLRDGRGQCVSADTPCIAANDTSTAYLPTLLAPTTLAAEAFVDRVELSWGGSGDAQVIVERNRNHLGWLEVGISPAGSTAFTDTQLIALDSHYAYRVHAEDAPCSSAASNEVEVYSFSKVPAALVATAVSSSEIAVSWADTNSLEAGYRLERSADGVTFEVVDGALAADTAAYADTGLPAATEYTYRLYAVNRSNALSQPATATGWTQATGLVRNNILYAEDFASYAVGTDATDWIDYLPDYSATVGDAFSVATVDLGQALFTHVLGESNLTSYYVDVGGSSTQWRDYSFAGRLRAAGSGVGVAVSVPEPSLHHGYELWAAETSDFGIAAPLLLAMSSMGSAPVAHVWYRFEMQTTTDAQTTRVRASIWPEGDPRPVGWQALYEDSRPNRTRMGTIGVKASGYDDRFWDDLRVVELASRLAVQPAVVTEGGSADVVVSLDVPNEDEVRVLWSTVPAGASAADFTEASGEVVLPPGRLSTTLAIPTTADTEVEGPETFVVRLFAATAAPIETPFATVTIQDDEAGGPLWAEGFTYPPGAVVPQWLDFEALYAATNNDDLFKITLLVGEPVLWRSHTNVTAITNDETAYLIVDGSEGWSSYEVTGDMRAEDPADGAGIVFFVQQPLTEHRMYRLRYVYGSDFHIASNNAPAPVGATTTGVIPAAGIWYSFRVQVSAGASATTIQARVWRRADPEPPTWQIDCTDSDVSRLVAGTIGVWSYGHSDRYWDNLVVTAL